MEQLSERRSWPSPQDYNEAVQNLQLNLSDVELQPARIATDSKGLPRPITGAFASVYKLSANDREWALRCFLHDVPDSAWRYQQIANFVLNDKLSYTVNFDYQAQGIRVHDSWFPIVKMTWVKGQTLEAYLRAHLQDRQVVESLCTSFMAMCADLQDAGIAHGDLQHGNIIVDEGQLYLVDYDGMYVPSMRGSLSAELGHPNYQHPLRNAQHFGDFLDNFSAWIIYASLYCIATDPKLFDLLGAGEDCLLFRHADFLEPSTSCAFAALENHQSGELRMLSQSIRSQLQRQADQVPPLSSLSEIRVDQLPPLAPGVPFDRKTWQASRNRKALERSSDTRIAATPGAESTTITYVPYEGQHGLLWQPPEKELLHPAPRKVEFDGSMNDLYPKQFWQTTAVFSFAALLIGFWQTELLFYVIGFLCLGVFLSVVAFAPRFAYAEFCQALAEYGQVARGKILRIDPGRNEFDAFGNVRYVRPRAFYSYKLNSQDEEILGDMELSESQLAAIGEGDICTVLHLRNRGSIIYKLGCYRAVSSP